MTGLARKPQNNDNKSGKYLENHNVKSEIRISKFETNSNNQNPNDLNKKTLCQGGLTKY